MKKISKSLAPLEARILMVDDEVEVTNILEKVLRRSGFKDLVVKNKPLEALDYCREAQPDLVILDLHMPEFSGFEVLQQLKNLSSDFELPPVMMLTADNNSAFRSKAFYLGALDFVDKPFERDIVGKVHNLLERRLLRKELHQHKIMLEERMESALSELRETQVEMAVRLGLAAEHRDDDTGEHVSRICQYTRIMALAYGESEARADLIGLAAKLHDIGKLGIPDSILQKPGKLTRQEFETMKSHTVVGATILGRANSKLLQLAEIIALNHHERWDGEGYPSGLKGEEIPLPARAVAVCDVFDALVSERPYKTAWPVERAVEFLKEQSGRQFDPFMVELFLQNLETILAIRGGSLEAA